MIAAVPGIGVPVHGAVGSDLEGRVSLLVEIFTVLGFDGGRIDRVCGEGDTSGCQEDHHGNHQPDHTQEAVLEIRRTTLPDAWSNSKRRERCFESAHCGSANTVSAPPSAV